MFWKLWHLLTFRNPATCPRRSVEEVVLNKKALSKSRIQCVSIKGSWTNLVWLSKHWVPDSFENMFENKFFHAPPKTKTWIPEVQQMPNVSKWCVSNIWSSSSARRLFLFLLLLLYASSLYLASSSSYLLSCSVIFLQFSCMSIVFCDMDCLFVCCSSAYICVLFLFFILSLLFFSLVFFFIVFCCIWMQITTSNQQRNTNIENH